jgi:glycosyltransferase involved in cell wall biosynthesis
MEMQSHPNIEVRRIPFAGAGWRQKIHYVFFSLWVLFTAFIWRPRWIYASDPFSCLTAFWLRQVGFHVLYHEHDGPALASESAFLKLVLICRRLLARCADVCVVPNAARAESLKVSTGTARPIIAVWNCPSRHESQMEDKPATRPEKFVLFYHGSIVPSRLPVVLIEALALVHDTVHLHIAGYETVGHPDYLSRLQRTAISLGIGHRIKALGAIPRRIDLLNLCRQADVGIALMPMHSDEPNELTMTGASNKPFDYMACGLAVMVSDLPEWNSMFVESGFGRACQSDRRLSIADQIHWFFSHPDETRQMGMRGREQIAREWNYETQFRPVREGITESCQD